MSDTTLYWLLTIPAAYCLFSVVLFLLSLKHEAPRPNPTKESDTQTVEDALPDELNRAVAEIRTRGEHVEVSRHNGTFAITWQPPTESFKDSSTP